MYSKNSILGDFRECFKQNHVWFLLSLYDIKIRYRRTVIGPFWVTLGTAITVFGMGIVWSSIFSVSMKEFLPYIATGLILWIFIASILSDGCSVFISQESIIHNAKTSFFLHIMTMLSRNFIILLHNAVVIIAIFILYRKQINFEILWVFPGIILLLLNSFWVAIFLGIFATRYRDVAPIITNIVTLIMLCTPIMWQENMLHGNRKLIVTFNPFAHMISIIREPLLGRSPSMESYYIVIGILILGLSVSLWLYKKFVHRIVYWM